MRNPLDKSKTVVGWLSFILPIGIAFPRDLFGDYGVIVIVLFYLGLAMPIAFYILCIVDGLRTFPRKFWCVWLLVFHFLKMPLFLLGLFVWYVFLFIRSFFSNGIPPPS